MRSTRLLPLIYISYFFGAAAMALIIRGLTGPPPDPSQGAVDLSGAYVVLGAVLIGGPVGIWLTMRLAGHRQPVLAAGIAAALALPALVLGQVLLFLVGLDDPKQVSNLVTAAVTCAPAMLIPFVVWWFRDRRHQTPQTR